ncbi:hypothetical protein F4809DRAFT_654690 [Biscogniauxia mediterranea]|nr:hypothetical protein F4809DRAFT_654690 [Biscogniauxia mediterranea]
MDPVSIAGITGFAVNLVELLGKTIRSVCDAYDKWRDADLFFLSLRAQLGTLKTALISIKSWLTFNVEDVHYLLQIELGVSMKCCQSLISKIDEFMAEVNDDASGVNQLTLRGRAKITFSGASMEDVLRMVDRQTNSMNLLLNACNCNTLSAQKSLLETPEVRSALKRTKEDSASLYVLRDSDSFWSRATSRITGVSSKLSLIFELDQELLKSAIYTLVHRESIRHRRVSGQSSKERVSVGPIIVRRRVGAC